MRLLCRPVRALGHRLGRADRRIYNVCAAAVVTMLVGASRVVLRLRWATDVLGGWVFGQPALQCEPQCQPGMGQRVALAAFDEIQARPRQMPPTGLVSRQQAQRRVGPHRGIPARLGLQRWPVERPEGAASARSPGWEQVPNRRAPPAAVGALRRFALVELLDQQMVKLVAQPGGYGRVGEHRSDGQHWHRR